MKALRIYTCTCVMAPSHQLAQCHMETGEIGTKICWRKTVQGRQPLLLRVETRETDSPSREKPGICLWCQRIHYGISEEKQLCTLLVFPFPDFQSLLYKEKSAILWALWRLCCNFHVRRTIYCFFTLCALLDPIQCLLRNWSPKSYWMSYEQVLSAHKSVHFKVFLVLILSNIGRVNLMLYFFTIHVSLKIIIKLGC